MNVADSTGDFQESAPVSGVRVEQLDEDEDEEEEEEEEGEYCTDLQYFGWAPG